MTDQIAELQSDRFRFLRHLHETVEGRRAVIVNMFELGEELGFSRTETSSVAEYLEGEYFIEYRTMGGGISITHSGVQEVERALSEPNVATDLSLPANALNVGSMVNSSVVQVASAQNELVESEPAQALKSKLIWFVIVPLVVMVAGGLILLWFEYSPQLGLGNATPEPVGTPATQELNSLDGQLSAAAIAPAETPGGCVADKRVDYQISISEVMAVPQAPSGDPAKETWNEYVELYNYGEESVDLEGWYIKDNSEADRLVSWDSVFPNIPVGDANTKSTCLAPGGYAVILPPAYDRGDRPYDSIPGDALILTLQESLTIGDGLIGLEAEVMERPPDALDLYFKDESGTSISVSSFGTPSEPADELPPTISIGSGWGGFRRIHVDGADTYSNWERFTWEERSPGR